MGNTQVDVTFAFVRRPRCMGIPATHIICCLHLGWCSTVVQAFWPPVKLFALVLLGALLIAWSEDCHCLQPLDHEHRCSADSLHQQSWERKTSSSPVRSEADVDGERCVTANAEQTLQEAGQPPAARVHAARLFNLLAAHEALDPELGYAQG